MKSARKNSRTLLAIALLTITNIYGSYCAEGILMNRDRIDLSAKCMDSGIMLDWSITSTNLISKITIKRSADLNNWQEIAVISSDDEESLSDFQHIDWHPSAGNNYYRIIAKDIYRTVILSDVQVADYSSGDHFIFPNPLSQGGELKIITPIEGSLFVTITDLAGNISIRKSLSPTVRTISTRQLSPGMYICRVKKNNSLHVYRLVIE